ncbi:hypothetical protein [Bradyrhizobium sp. JR3.5]
MFYLDVFRSDLAIEASFVLRKQEAWPDCGCTAARTALAPGGCKVGWSESGLSRVMIRIT